jgi:hypothetical protein
MIQSKWQITALEIDMLSSVNRTKIIIFGKSHIISNICTNIRQTTFNYASSEECKI